MESVDEGEEGMMGVLKEGGAKNKMNGFAAPAPGLVNVRLLSSILSAS